MGMVRWCFARCGEGCVVVKEAYLGEWLVVLCALVEMRCAGQGVEQDTECLLA